MIEKMKMKFGQLSEEGRARFVTIVLVIIILFGLAVLVNVYEVMSSDVDQIALAEGVELDDPQFVGAPIFVGDETLQLASANPGTAITEGNDEDNVFGVFYPGSSGMGFLDFLGIGGLGAGVGTGAAFLAGNGDDDNNGDGSNPNINLSLVNNNDNLGNDELDENEEVENEQGDDEGEDEEDENNGEETNNTEEEIIELTSVSTPEPATLALLGGGLIPLLRKRRK